MAVRSAAMSIAFEASLGYEAQHYRLAGVIVAGGENITGRQADIFIMPSVARS